MSFLCSQGETIKEELLQELSQHEAEVQELGLDTSRFVVQVWLCHCSHSSICSWGKSQQMCNLTIYYSGMLCQTFHSSICSWGGISDAHFHQSPVTGQLKVKETNCTNLHQNLGPIKVQFWWSVPLFLWFHRQACYCFHTIFKPQVSANTSVLTNASRLHVSAEVSGHAYIVQGQSATCFIGCKAETKVTSWSETSIRVWQLFLDWLLVM